MSPRRYQESGGQVSGLRYRAQELSGLARSYSDTVTPMLEVRNLRKTYGSIVAVDDVSFRVGRGELVAVLGPNGAGKTTTVSIISGLVTPERGEVSIGGARLRGDADPLKRRIG